MVARSAGVSICEDKPQLCPECGNRWGQKRVRYDFNDSLHNRCPMRDYYIYERCPTCEGVGEK
jgi:predicted  nucleic acid-binding Zn ribbon protein